MIVNLVKRGVKYDAYHTHLIHRYDAHHTHLIHRYDAYHTHLIHRYDAYHTHLIHRYDAHHTHLIHQYDAHHTHLIHRSSHWLRVNRLMQENELSSSLFFLCEFHSQSLWISYRGYCIYILSNLHFITSLFHQINGRWENKLKYIIITIIIEY